MDKTAPAVVKFFDVDGRWIGGHSLHLPGYLDWMPIEVKAHYFEFMGMGPANTKQVLLMSQGEQRLLSNVTLRELDHREYKEKLDEAQQAVDRFIDEHGYSRTPRNQ